MIKIENIIIYHFGAREKYFISKYFLKKNILSVLITDYWFSPKNLIYKIFPNKVSRRFDSELDKKCYHYNIFEFLYALWVRKNIKPKFRELSIIGKQFCLFANKYINKRIKKGTLLWGYTWGNLEVLQKYNTNTDVIKLHDQIDPGIEYYRVYQRLLEEYPNIEITNKTLFPDNKYLVRVKTEWNLADIILVNSNYSKKCLIKENVDEEKIITIPLIYENKRDIKINYKDNAIQLKVGFVGNINLIKGFYLFFEVAKKLSSNICFFAAGNNHLSNEFMQEAKEYIHFTGHLSEKEMKIFYTELDVLIFPTYCDGFGMVQLEAMSYGIPVLASENCGDVVLDGINGFVIKHNYDDIIQKLKLLDNDRDRLFEMSINAKKRISDFSFESYDSILRTALKKKGFYF